MGGLGVSRGMAWTVRTVIQNLRNINFLDFLDSFPLFFATSGHIQTREEWAQVSKELDSKELETKKTKKLTNK